MYSSPVPLLVIRTDVEALVYVNDRMLGECGPGRCATLPVSDSGDYYLCAQPLVGRRFALTRRLRFEAGALTRAVPDVRVCAWPGGVYECLLQTVSLPSAMKGACASRELQSCAYAGHMVTLYWEGTLKLCIEKNGRPLYGYSLGEGTAGELIPYGAYMAVLVRTGGGERLLLLDKALQAVLELQGDAIELGDGIAVIDRLGTRLGHERRTRYAPGPEGFAELGTEVGFFTHAYARPATESELALAFFEAVAAGQAEEAMGYLAPPLRESCTFADIVEFLGPYDEARLPFSDASGQHVGLASAAPGRGGLAEVRLYALQFEGEHIGNITET